LLTHVVAALHAARGFARGLYRRQKQSDQNSNNGNYDQKFDKREATR
jgi:hypothetical protein